MNKLMLVALTNGLCLIGKRGGGGGEEEEGWHSDGISVG